MRELERQAVSDMSREVGGMRAGSTSLLLLVRPKAMAVKTKIMKMFFMVAVSVIVVEEQRRSC